MIVEHTYHQGEPVHREANDIAERLWNAMGKPTDRIDPAILTGAIICFLINFIENHVLPEQRTRYVDMLALSLKASLEVKGTHHPAPEQRQ